MDKTTNINNLLISTISKTEGSHFTNMDQNMVEQYLDQLSFAIGGYLSDNNNDNTFLDIDKKSKSEINLDKKILINNLRSITKDISFAYQEKVFFLDLVQYHGVVNKIDKYSNRFTAELINNATKHMIYAEFSLEDVPNKIFVEEGAMFVWLMGKSNEKGRYQSFSEFIFRNKSKWSKYELNRIDEISEKRANNVRELLAEVNK